jgi:hypothetical protein
LNPDTILRLAALIAALGSITVEDLAAIKQAETLGPDIATNIKTLQGMAGSIDDETIALLNQARSDAGLPTV